MTWDPEDTITGETLRTTLGDFYMHLDSPEPATQEVEDIIDDYSTWV
jgi:hypothetical protein